MVELCIHIANVLYLFSYLGRDMLWLRALTCGGLVLGLLFFTCQPTPLYGPSVWHVVFLVINAFQIRSLLVQRRQQMLTEEQERLGEAAFHDLSRDELLTLLTHVTYETPGRLANIKQICHQQLTQDERVLRDLAFAGLSRGELLNLLTRRMWNSIRRGKPARWGRRRQAHRGRGSAESQREVISGPATG
ncbi:hypothetical protein V5E97_25690 [Singulisphaera sp. Ch08]|uniref:POPDC1-3 domain-containing protein n=1 Tax=Singulisphaera sp. Ch08 TaxID=3120278 RepID=A0AAU7C9E0_9BACT